VNQEPQGWLVTDKGRRAALFVLRWYGIVLVGGIVLAFAVGIGAGWWLRGLPW